NKVAINERLQCGEGRGCLELGVRQMADDTVLVPFDQGDQADAQKRINAHVDDLVIDNFAILDPDRFMRQFNAQFPNTFNLQFDALDSPAALIAMEAALED